MMSAWHLLWIIPLAASFGFMWAALLAAGRDSPERREGET